MDRAGSYVVSVPCHRALPLLTTALRNSMEVGHVELAAHVMIDHAVEYALQAQAAPNVDPSLPRAGRDRAEHGLTASPIEH
jgi:hypothetical protein